MNRNNQPHLSRGGRGELYHFGIEGMKWGVRRFQNSDGTLTEAGKRRYGKGRTDRVEKKLNKKKEQYEDIVEKSNYNEMKSRKKNRYEAGEFYKRQTEDALKNINTIKKMSELYKETPEKKKKLNNFISIVSNKPLRDIADAELRKARESASTAVTESDRDVARAKNDEAMRMYRIAQRKRPEYQNYYSKR